MLSRLLRPLRKLLPSRRVLHAEPEWVDVAGTEWSERIMDMPATDRLHIKQGRSIARWAGSHQGRTLTVYLKRHHRLSWWAGLCARLFPWKPWSPGLQEWLNLQRARSIGLPVARAVAGGEFLDGAFRLRSFLAVEELTGMLGLHEAVPLARQRLDPQSFARWKRGLIVELARLVNILHDRSLFHKDLYFCHFYILESDCSTVPTDWTGRMVVIDLHRLARHRLTHAWWLCKDLAQLAYSSEVPGVTARDRLRFRQALRPNGGWWWNLLERVVRMRWNNYRRHNRPANGGA